MKDHIIKCAAFYGAVLTVVVLSIAHTIIDANEQSVVRAEQEMKGK
jgi:hypothetical protein